MSRDLELGPITPDMADDWREHIMPVLPDSLAISFSVLATRAYERLDERQLNPRGSVANAVLAMAAESELVVTEQGNIRSALSKTRVA